jgi:DNA-binding transcriptional regulator YiaG
MKTNDTKGKFSDALRSWRARRKLTQAVAARLIGVPIRTWQNWEIGWRVPRQYHQRLVLEAIRRLGE